MSWTRSARWLAGVVGLGLGCGSPNSLWLSYSQEEIDLVLVNYEPPPF